MTFKLTCPKCGEEITDEDIERSMRYAYDTGFDEGFETAMEEGFYGGCDDADRDADCS